MTEKCTRYLLCVGTELVDAAVVLCSPCSKFLRRNEGHSLLSKGLSVSYGATLPSDSNHCLPTFQLSYKNKSHLTRIANVLDEAHLYGLGRSRWNYFIESGNFPYLNKKKYRATETVLKPWSSALGELCGRSWWLSGSVP